MSYSQAFLDNLRTRSSLADLIGADMPLRRAGREFEGLCPFHQEKSPSFTVVPEKGFWHCFGCGAHGTAIDWVMHHRKLDFLEAVKWLADREGLVPDAIDEDAFRKARAAARANDVAAMTQERARAFDIWKAGRPIVAGGAVAHYLEKVRGIPSRTWQGIVVLREHAALTYWITKDKRPEPLGTFPAMLACIQGYEGKFAAVHMTYLEPGGRGKLDLKRRGFDPKRNKAKKVRGAPQGGAIRLFQPSGVLAVAEGIETALSVATAVPMAVWAAYSLGNWAGPAADQGPPHPTKPNAWLPGLVPLEGGNALVPPPMVREVIWCADADSGDRLIAERLMQRGAARLTQKGFAVRIARPPEGTDFNDLIRGAK